MRRLSLEGPALGEQSSPNSAGWSASSERYDGLIGTLVGLDQQGGLSEDVMDCFDLVNPF